MSSKTVAGSLLLFGLAVACGSQAGPDSTTEPPTTENAPPTTGPGTTPPPAIATREFTCDASAVTKDTQLPGGSAENLRVRPTGAPCANQLVYAAPGAPEHQVSSQPGMIVLGNVKTVGSSLVVCLSNEKHVPAASGDPLDRYSEAVQIECAARGATQAWSPTVAVVTGANDYAAWMVDIAPGATPEKMIVRWMRDSSFQFLNTTEEGRPATDGIYETIVSLSGGVLTVESTTKAAGPMFTSSVSVSE